MALTGPTNNEDVAVVQTAQKNANVWHAIHINIVKDPNDPTATVVRTVFVRGYDEAGTFVEVERVRAVFDAAQIGPYMLGQVVAGNTLEQDFKEKLWACATEHTEEVPAGTVG